MDYTIRQIAYWRKKTEPRQSTTNPAPVCCNYCSPYFSSALKGTVGPLIAHPIYGSSENCGHATHDDLCLSFFAFLGGMGNLQPGCLVYSKRMSVPRLSNAQFCSTRRNPHQYAAVPVYLRYGTRPVQPVSEYQEAIIDKLVDRPGP